MIAAALATLKTDKQRNELAVFYEKNLGKLYSVAISKLHKRDAAEDAIQETFLRICKYPDKFFEIDADKQLPYTVIIIGNVISNMLIDKRKCNYCELTEDIPSDARSVEDISLGNISFVELEKFIRSLPEALRQTITLKTTYNMSTEQIAGVLGITEAAVRKRLSNAYKRIKDFLKGE